jgi:hypothetical protein
MRIRESGVRSQELWHDSGEQVSFFVIPVLYRNLLRKKVMPRLDGLPLLHAGVIQSSAYFVDCPIKSGNDKFFFARLKYNFKSKSV